MNVHAITHHGCPDGLASLMVLEDAFPGIVIHPGIHGEPPPDGLAGEVYIADFSYPREQMQAICDNPAVSAVQLLDHHATALRALDGFDHPKFSNGSILTMSGAAITYLAYAHRCGGDYQTLVDYVQDADLWRFELPNSQEIRAVVMTQKTTSDMRQLAEQMRRNFDGVVSAGATVLKFRTKVVGDIAARARPVEVLGHVVPVVESPYSFGSEVAGELAKGQLFAAYYLDWPDGTRQWGLRSDEDGMDVAALAETVGGGGHKHAAGFKEQL